MKILDWMHRNLHPATNYSRVSQRKAPAFEHDVVHLTDSVHHRTPSAAAAAAAAAAGIEIPDTEAPLLLHVNLAGILTIGTLGHSHPLLLPHFSEEPKLDLPEKEIQPAAKPPTQITLLQPVAELFMIKTKQSVHVVDTPEEKIMVEPLLKEDRERKERTTLADLLAAELADVGDQPPTVAGPPKSAATSGLKSNSKEKKKVKKKKKKGDDLEPSESPSAAKRIHRMITRMLKKKIHPEAAATGRTGGGAAAIGADLIPCSGGGDGDAA